MRKAVMIVLALLAIRLLPKALRREARALELLTLLFQVTAAAAIPPATSKAYATEGRTGILESRVGKMQSQRGTVGGFGANVPNLGTTQSGTVQTGGVNRSGALTQAANTTSSGQTSGPNSGSFAGHTHDYGGHNHGFDHFHFTQVDGDYNGFAASYDTTLATLNQMKTALVNAGIL